MSRYKVVTGKPGESHRIEIVGDDGTHQTMLGFSSEDEANQWIATDRRRERLLLATRLDGAD